MMQIDALRHSIGRPIADLTGQKIGKRIVLGIAARTSGSRFQWNVRCECGHEFVCLTQDLRRGGPCIRCGHKGPRPYRRKRPYEATYNIFVGRAKYPVLLTYEQFVVLTKIKECHYCGAEIAWQEYRHPSCGGTGSNLDRKDSDGPYSIENVVVCCGRCNYAKNDHFTYEEWRELGTVIHSWKDRAVKDEYQIKLDTSLRADEFAAVAGVTEARDAVNV